MLLDKNDSLVLLIDVQEKLISHIKDYQHLIERCEWVLRLATKLGVAILASEQYPKGLGPIIPSLKQYCRQEECIDKTHFSCLSEPHYVERLEQLNKKQLILIGIETHVCVLQTALEMKDKGYEVYVVVDAVGSRKEIDNKYGLKRMKQEKIHLLTTEMIFFEWIRKAATPEFKALSQEFLRS